MPRTKRGESTVQQFAYAQRLFGGQGKCRKEIALNVGYSPSSSNKVKEKIESTVGFHSAMTKLAVDSNNLALAAMHEFKTRGFTEFSNKDLVGALNAIGNAWSKFNERENRKREEPVNTNKLRTIVMNHIEQQTLNTGAIHEALPAQKETVVDVEEVDVDF